MTGTQELCSGSDPSDPVPVKPCSQLPAPRIRTPEIGDDFVVVTQSLSGARIQIFAETGQKLGDGSGSRVGLIRNIEPNEALSVRQVVGNCSGQTFWVTGSVCKKTDEHPDPASDGSFDVGQFDYQLSDTTVGSTQSRVAAHVRYPVAPNSETQLSSWGGEFPIVFLLHGNHGVWRNPELDYEDYQRDKCSEDPEEPHTPPHPDWNVEVPSHRGYDYVMDALAKRGYIAVSIDGFDVNCRTDHIPEQLCPDNCVDSVGPMWPA